MTKPWVDGPVSRDDSYRQAGPGMGRGTRERAHHHVLPGFRHAQIRASGRPAGAGGTDSGRGRVTGAGVQAVHARATPGSTPAPTSSTTARSRSTVTSIRSTRPWSRRCATGRRTTTPGSIGPDGFPDLTMGQSIIHPVRHRPVAEVHPRQAWAAQSDPSYSAAEKSQILAFAYGFLTHAAGDMWAHTLVNELSGEVFPGGRRRPDEPGRGVDRDPAHHRRGVHRRRHPGLRREPRPDDAAATATVSDDSRRASPSTRRTGSSTRRSSAQNAAAPSTRARPADRLLHRPAVLASPTSSPASPQPIAGGPRRSSTRRATT